MRLTYSFVHPADVCLLLGEFTARFLPPKEIRFFVGFNEEESFRVKMTRIPLEKIGSVWLDESLYNHFAGEVSVNTVM